MIDPTSNPVALTEQRENQSSDVLAKIYAAAQPGAVYSEPVTAGNYTVITASEIMAAGGFGSGLGFGPSPASSLEETAQPQIQQPGGSGIGGGGTSTGRPVAVISIGPDGVTVQPIVDITKIALAGVAIWGTMLMLLGRMLKTRKR